MNQFKNYINKNLSILKIFTYADNNAITYFTKQNFIKLHKLEIGTKYLKEYKAATPMLATLDNRCF